MKYIKTFENKEEYKVGDWIFLKYTEFGSNPPEFIAFIDSTPCKIIKITEKDRKFYECEYIESPNPDVFSFVVRQVSRSSINRKLTPEEIKDYQIKIDAKKYNL